MNEKKVVHKKPSEAMNPALAKKYEAEERMAKSSVDDAMESSLARSLAQRSTKRSEEHTS